MSNLDTLLTDLSSRQARVLELQTRLTACHALGPENGGQGEVQKAQQISHWLHDAGIRDIQYINIPDERVECRYRPNIIAHIPGKTRQTLWLFAHMDVVPTGALDAWKTDPWTVHCEGDRLYGRGVEDNQQGLVSMLLVAEALMHNGITPQRSLGLVFMADEESGNTYGLDAVLEQCPDRFDHDDLYLIPDSGSPDARAIEIAEKAIYQLRIQVHGLQGHASTPHKAHNAFCAGAALVLALEQGLSRDFPQENPLFDPPTSTFTPTRHDANGLGINVVPGEDCFYLDCRLLPDVEPDAVLKKAQTCAEQIAEERHVHITITPHHYQAASATDAQSPIVQSLMPAIQAIYGVHGVPMGIGGGTVAALLRHRGLPAAVWSCIHNTCHQHNEFSSISATLNDAKVFAHVLMS